MEADEAWVVENKCVAERTPLAARGGDQRCSFRLRHRSRLIQRQQLRGARARCKTGTDLLSTSLPPGPALISSPSPYHGSAERRPPLMKRKETLLPLIHKAALRRDLSKRICLISE